MRPFLTSALTVLLGLGMAASGLRAQAGESTTTPPRNSALVIVNTQAILPDVPGAKEAQETFQQEIAGFESEVQKLRAEVDSLLTAYRRQEATLSPETKEQRQQEIIQKQQKLQQRAAELEQKAGARQQELLQPILDRVRAAIEEIREENGYTVVLDVASAGVVAADPDLDITELVLERLEAGAQGAASANPPR